MVDSNINIPDDTRRSRGIWMNNEDKARELLKANEDGKILGYRFSNIRVLKRAFTRAAYAKELQDKTKKEHEHQEPLATLGDAILKAALTDFMFHTDLKTAQEITEAKSKQESDPALAKWADRLELSQYIMLGGSEEAGGLEKTPSILATTFEALIGALYLDTGCDLNRVKEIIVPWHALLLENQP
jgi:ribonuclease-3